MKKVVLIVVAIAVVVLIIVGINSCNRQKDNTITVDVPAVEVK